MQKNHLEYFNHSNITLQFLPGNHTLDVDLTITSIQTQYLEIRGNTTSPTPKYRHMQSQSWIWVQGYFRCESY